MQDNRSRPALTQLELDFAAPAPIELANPDELFEAADEELLRSLAEDRRFERKSTRIDLKQLGEYVCMVRFRGQYTQSLFLRSFPSARH